MQGYMKTGVGAAAENPSQDLAELTNSLSPNRFQPAVIGETLCQQPRFQ